MLYIYLLHVEAAMLDTEYINEMRALDNKDAKTMLADYGKTFGIDLKKTKSFDNMLADLEELSLIHI